MTLTRREILAALVRTFEPLPFVYAMWEGGAAAWNRTDEWSDIDVQFDVDDAHADQVIPLLEQTLIALSPIELRFPVTQSVFQLHAQVFYRLRDTSPFLLIDAAVIKHSSAAKFLEPEIHGNAVVHFDKANVTRTAGVDASGWKKQLAARVESLRTTFRLFQVLTLKELNRHNSLEAFSFYQAYTIRPLAELLRIRYSPYHYNFHTRYIHYELPRDVIGRLESLVFVSSAEDIRAKREQAEQWFNEMLAQFDAGAGARNPDWPNGANLT